MSGIEHANGHKPIGLSHMVDPSFAKAERADPAECGFPLAEVLRAVVLLRATAPEDAFSASYLGTEREGNAILLDSDGLYLTIGYLINEAEHVLLGSDEAEVVPAQVLAYDYESGFGLLRAASTLSAAPVELGDSSTVREKDSLIAAARGGVGQAIKAEVVSTREFAGYWEYLLDEAIFTAPPHTHWSGAGLFDGAGRLVGLGSLFVQDARPEGGPSAGNMFVPINVYKEVVDDLLAHGRRPGPPRPWLGIYSVQALGRVLISSVSERGPAAAAGVEAGDVVLAVNDGDVASIAEMYRRIWQTGPAGTVVELKILRDANVVRIDVATVDRDSFMKTPRAH